MFWHIELKFCIWLYFTVLQINFKCCQFLWELWPLLELTILEIHCFSAVFSYMLWHIAVKFCIWLRFTVLQIKFECRQFPSSFVGVMPFLEHTILEIHCFPQFFPTCFDILLWNFAYDFVFTVLQIKFKCCQFPSIFVGVMPLLELKILEIHSFLHFPPTCFDLLTWNFACHFLLINIRSSSSVVNFRQFL